MIVINMIMILSIVVVLILCFDALITFQLACESLCIGFDYFKVSITGKEVSEKQWSPSFLFSVKISAWFSMYSTY